jgi:uncharacterized protein DUF4386
MTATLTEPALRTTTDTRTYWRVLLAVIAPLPLLAMGVSYLLSPTDGDADVATTVAGVEAHPGRALISMLTGLLFVIFLPPATAALAWVTRRRAPRLTAVGASLTLLGLLTGFATLPAGNNIAWIAEQKDLDLQMIQTLDDALWAQPTSNVGILLFLAAITIGLPLLGIALWRSKAAPRWMAICLIVGMATHMFTPGHVAQGIGLLVGAVGFVGVGRALLRMRNDDFDLPPVTG